MSKGPKMGFFKFYEKLAGRIFQISRMKLQQHKVLKLILFMVLGKNLFRGLQAKRGQTGPKMIFKVLWKIDAKEFSDIIA